MLLISNVPDIVLVCDVHLMFVGYRGKYYDIICETFKQK